MTDVTAPTSPAPDRVTGSGRNDPPGAGPGDHGGGRPGRSRAPALWQVIALVVALCALAGAVGWQIGQRKDPAPSASSVDVGFFYDMSAHHQQAITMALDYLRYGTDPRLLQMANEIVTYQSSEIGVMNTYLSQWGRTGDRPSMAMGWMQPPVPYDQMPGLATKAQMAELAAARGTALDDLFTTLMINHHAGGVHMAAYAAQHADLASTRKIAAGMDSGQRGEISEMNTWRTQHGLPTIVPPLAEFTPKASTSSS
ncbi:MAG: DUF305 domain-containing protein [Acidimicrobiia bacterium]